MTIVGGTEPAGAPAPASDPEVESRGASTVDVAVIATGVVAPNGVGPGFFEAQFAGTSGIRPLNDWRDVNADTLLDVRTLFTLTMAFVHLPDAHPLRRRVLTILNRRLEEGCELATGAGVDPSTVVLAGQELQRTVESFVHLLRGKHPDRSPSIRPAWDERTTTRMDAFGVVDNRLLLPMLLPLCSQLLKRPPDDLRFFKIEPHLTDALFLTIPRAAQLAWVAALWCLSEAAGADTCLRDLPPLDLGTIAAEAKTFAVPTRRSSDDDDTESPIVVDTSALSEALKNTAIHDYDQRASKVIQSVVGQISRWVGKHRDRIGVYVGTGGSNTDAGTRLAGKVAHSLGLQAGTNVVTPVPVDDPDSTHRLDVRPPGDTHIPAAWMGEWHWALYNDANQFNYGYTAGLICRCFKLRGDQATVTTGCCSGAAAAVAAVRALRRERAEMILAVGTDCALGGETFLPFLARGWLRKTSVAEGDDPDRLVADACTPYPTDAASAGWVFGEGSGAVLLARPDKEPGRGPISHVQATAMGNDGHFMFNPTSRARILRDCLEYAPGLLPPGEGMVLGFGLGDLEYDTGEIGALMMALQGLSGDLRGLASLKSEIGHSLGGSSLIAVAVAHQMLHRPTALRTLRRRDAGNGMLLTSPVQTPRAAVPIPRLDWVVTNGSGMGGTGVSLLLTRDRRPTTGNGS
jgi:3-oxoacyl-(acyl-carrier-protein) synthase